MAEPLLTQQEFTFPYDYKFPGQATDERILFVTRENKIVLFTRLLFLVISLLVAFGLIVGLQQLVAAAIGVGWGTTLTLFILGGAGLFGALTWWWMTILWEKSVAIVTTKRLVKLIYTTPFNRHVLSLPLEMIVDTGAYTKGFIQAIFKLGTFTARSAATSSGVATDDGIGSRVNKKYFYIENIDSAEDLQHYITKLLEKRKKVSEEKLQLFRPFVPHLKGEHRKQFMEKYPDYWS